MLFLKSIRLFFCLTNLLSPFYVPGCDKLLNTISNKKQIDEERKTNGENYYFHIESDLRTLYDKHHSCTHGTALGAEAKTNTLIWNYMFRR